MRDKNGRTEEKIQLDRVIKRFLYCESQPTQKDRKSKAIYFRGQESAVYKQPSLSLQNKMVVALKSPAALN